MMYHDKSRYDSIHMVVAWRPHGSLWSFSSGISNGCAGCDQSVPSLRVFRVRVEAVAVAKALLDGRVNEKRANASGQRRGPGHLPDGGVEGEDI